MLKIGFDLDNCISKTGEAILASLIAKGLVPANATLNDAPWIKWEWDADAGTGFPNVTFEDMRAVFMEPAFWISLETHLFPTSLLRDLATRAEIHIVTDRRWFPELRDLTVQWLSKNFIPYDRLVICKGDEKAAYCDEAMIDIFVEDCAENAIGIAENVVSVYLAETAWNADAELPVNCLRAPWKIIASDLCTQIDVEEYMCLAHDLLDSTWISAHIRKVLFGEKAEAA